ncbi:MAG: anaerobic sulfatase maturase [Anaerolineae bacterium]|nr:anaerobic sulfatase maturase [Anaerolineae bacterium]
MNDTIRSHSPRAFHIMVKPSGAVCNLDCKYCYFLSKERLYPGSAFRMPDDVLEDFTRQYIAAQRVPVVTFGWQGGEPTLMGVDFFRKAVEYQEQYRRSGMRMVNTLQTNGTLLDDEWCAFFREHNFLIGVSIDGPPTLHDAYRVDKGGHPTLDRVLAGVNLLKKHGVEFNTLTTVHAANVDHPLAVYRFLRDQVESRFMQFIPIIERDNDTGYQEGEQLTDRSVTGEQYGRFLIDIFDEWVYRDVAHVSVQLFEVALAAWLGRRPGLCVFEKTCGAAMVLEHNGDLYTCDHFVEPRCFLGNIAETPLADLAGSEQQQQFGHAKRDTLPRMCRECEVRFVCNGGCPKNRVLHTPEGEPGLNALCAGYKAFFTHIDRPMQLMANMLRAEQSPADIMLFLAQEQVELERQFKMVGRNDPCPCGSGLKFKHCHGRRQNYKPPRKSR